MKRFLVSIAVGLGALNLVCLPAVILGTRWAAVANLGAIALGCAYLVRRELR